VKGAGLPKQLIVLIGGIAVAAVALMAWILRSGFSWRTALAFGLLAFLAQQFPLTLPSGGSYSVAYVIWIAAMVAVGPGEAAVAAAFGTLTLTDRRLLHEPASRKIFNASQQMLSACLGGLVYRAAGGQVQVPSSLSLPVLVALAAAVPVTFVVNTGLVASAIGLAKKRRPLMVWREEFLPLWAAHLAFALLGALLATLYIRYGWAAILFLLAPLLIARHAFHGALALFEAYDTTVRSVARTIETKDPYTRGHAERVAQLSEMVARAYGVKGEELSLIRYAALLHDVGKLGSSNRVLKKAGKLTPEEYEHMKLHPTLGAEILRNIEWLRPALVVPLHHHERFDGRGYPDGLAGRDIPLLARLVTVADAFDAMTSTRTYRRALSVEAALGEIERCSGTQFDPDAVRALKRAVASAGWQPAPENEDGEESLDHAV
jgi:putative nucleotidyltransferase with HDIG domain